MPARIQTVAIQGIDVVPVDVQVMIAPGNLGFRIVGLADKAVGEVASGCARRCVPWGWR